MEFIRALLSLCSSAAAMFAIALAYDSHKKVEQLEKQIDDRPEERDEVADSRNVRTDGDGGE